MTGFYSLERYCLKYDLLNHANLRLEILFKIQSNCFIDIWLLLCANVITISFQCFAFLCNMNITRFCVPKESTYFNLL